MVLYEKSGNFVGIGKEELSFLGYEDFDEFKSENKDFADLFVNKPGYIFKFKNFSWIDYTLHSGAPKKSVIIKLKNGQEVETTLKISEIFLNSSIDSQNVYYGIELSKNNFAQTSFTQSTPATELNIQEEEFNAPNVQEEIHEPTVSLNLDKDYSDNTELVSDFKIDEEVLIKEEPLEDLPINEVSFEEDFTPDASADFKLKIDEDVYDNSIAEDFSPEPTPSYEEDFNPSILTEINQDLEQNDESSGIEAEEFDFDISTCAENTGLDLSDIAQILEDYIQKIDASNTQIQEALNNKDNEKTNALIVKIKGVADTLCIESFSQQLKKILDTDDFDKKQKSYDTFVAYANQLKNELI